MTKLLRNVFIGLAATLLGLALYLAMIVTLPVLFVWYFPDLKDWAAALFDP
ncbi:MAG: hypothetical protein ACPGJS_00775 [Flammeovirgaceae bacterium]